MPAAFQGISQEPTAGLAERDTHAEERFQQAAGAIQAVNKVCGKLHFDFVLPEAQAAHVLEDEVHILLLCQGVRQKKQGLLNAALHRVPRNAGVQGYRGVIQENNGKST